MTAPIANIPVWATDPTFTDSSEAGETPRVEPSLAEKGQGIRPGSFAARIMNWILGSSGDWLAHLAKAHPRSWRREVSGSLPWSGATYLTVSGDPASTGAGGWIVPGFVDGTSDLATSFLWPAPQDSTGEISQTARFGVAGPVGLVSPAFTSVGICSNGNVVYGVSADPSSARTCVFVGTVTGTTAPSVTLLFGESYLPTKVAASGSIVAVVPASNDGWVDGATFWVSTDSGASFYQRTISGSPGAKTVSCVSVDSEGTIVIAMYDEDVIVFVYDNGLTLQYTSTPAASGFVGLSKTRSGWHALSRSER